MVGLKQILPPIIFVFGTAMGAFAQSTWTPRTSGISNILYSVIWTGTQFVAAGDSGRILTSANGVAWTSRTSGTTNPLLALGFNSSQLVVVGDSGTILTSPNGVTWTSRNSGTILKLTSIVWANNKWVAAGNDNSSAKSLTSPDGMIWTSWNLGVTSGVSLVWRGSSVDSTSRLMAIGGGSDIRISSNGQTWTQKTLPAVGAIFYNVIWTGTKLLVPGFNSKNNTGIFQIADSTNWNYQAAGTTNALYSVAWTGSQFVAVGAAGTVLTSQDAATWTGKNSGTTTSLRFVVWSGSQFVAVGNNGIILTSTQDATPIIPQISRQNNNYRTFYSISGRRMEPQKNHGPGIWITKPVSIVQ